MAAKEEGAQRMAPLTAQEGGGEGEDLAGTESFLVGLAPTYWSHVPLFIGQIVDDLVLRNGVHCLPIVAVNENNNNNNNNNNDNQTTTARTKLVPLTRCKLVARIVAAERKGGCVQYLLDDGTGLIDCLHWDDDEEEDGGLPSLTLTAAAAAADAGQLLPIGELVGVHGKIQCADVASALLAGAAGANNNNNSLDTTTTTTTKVRMIREIHASLVQPLAAQPSRRARPRALEPEWHHWLDCIRIQRQQQQQDASSTSTAKDVLQLLGPAIAGQVADRGNLPSADDAVGAWRLFGAQCPCAGPAERRLKQNLLYCHCIATAEPLDPSYAYRDRLLLRLLSLERRSHEEAAAATTTAKDNSDDDDNDDDQKRQPLRFLYQDVLEDEDLNRVAETVLSSLVHHSAGTASQRTPQISELVRGTVRALRHDGILHLDDPEMDAYLLVSQAGVLAPYVRRSLRCRDNLERARFHSERPDFLARVPRARVQLVKRAVLLEQQQRPTLSPSNNDSDANTESGDSSGTNPMTQSN